MNKKGISAVVATVLIVLITVAAVTIFWMSILPIINQGPSEALACFEAQTTLKLDDDARYTCYDEDEEEIKYRFIRTSDEAEDLKGAILYVVSEGNTINQTELSESEIPEINLRKTGKINADGWTLDWEKEILLSFAPTVLVGGEPKPCDESKSIVLRPCQD